MSPPAGGWVPGNSLDGLTTENIKVGKARPGGVTWGYHSSAANMPAPRQGDALTMGISFSRHFLCVSKLLSFLVWPLSC
jgi:hypothetical protein